jgi:mannosyltransferase OCH1-like enzyme
VNASPLLIPRIIHRIWLGSEPLPDEFGEYGDSWRRQHPDWEMRLWTDDDLPEVSDVETLARARTPAERADVVRLELLRRFGGVYTDTDVECQRSLEPLIAGVSAFACFSRPGHVGTAVIGSVPGHPALERAVREVSGRVGEGHIGDVAGPKYFTRLVADFPDIVVFDQATFYPFRSSEPYLRGKKYPDAYTIHHWSATWKSREAYAEQVEKLRGKLERQRQRTKRAEAQRAKAERRLAGIQASRWWRLRGGLARLAGPARPLLSSARARLRR